MKLTKYGMAVALTGVAMLALSGCKTTVVERPTPDPQHYDDHHDDHHDAPQPPPDRRDDHR